MSQQRVNNIAIVLQNASTGGWRFTCRLIEGLRATRPELKLTAYLGNKLKAIGEQRAPQNILAGLGVDVRPLPRLKGIDRRSPMRLAWSRLRYGTNYLGYRRWCSSVREHDLLFFAWPFGIECPDIDRPMAFIPHDFNYTHFTGMFVDSLDAGRAMRSQHQRWLERARPVVSSQFIADDLKRAFLSYRYEPRIIPLSRLANDEPIPHSEAIQLVRGMGVDGDYLLCLNNGSAHKNLGQVLSGFHYVRHHFPNLRLILVGFGTEGISGDANTPYYLDNTPNGSVQSLGLRNDREVNALISKARLVINASLYEAGNGSGLDAWALGTPVAMSAIPPFLEQMAHLGVQAETFHPRCCFEVRDAMLRILSDPDRASRNAQQSKRAMQNYTWTHVATEYCKFFDSLNRE